MSATTDALMERLLEEVPGVLPSGQFALAREGEIVASEAVGDAGTDTRYVVYSVTKAVTSAAVWILLGETDLDLATRVADLVPGFANNGKQDVTVEHLLTHTAGFPHAPMPPDVAADRDARRERMSSWRLDFPPDTGFRYHPRSSFWVLAEVIAVVSDMDHRAFIHDRVIAPLGLTCLAVGVVGDESPATAFADVATVTMVGEPGEVGGDTLRLETILGEGTEPHLLSFNDPARLAVGAPGSGGVSTAADIARLYQAFLHNPDGLWDPEVLADATGHVRVTYEDPVTHVPANRTAGLIVAGGDGMAVMRQFGERVGPRTFGHPGVGGQIAWADPDSGVSFCFLTNGLDRDLVRTFVRTTDLCDLAAG